MVLLYSVEAVICFFLVFHFAMYWLARGVVGKKQPVESKGEIDFACIVTAYKDLQVTLPLLYSLEKQTYRRFIIYLVADRCAPVTVNLPNLHILYPASPLDSKVKSIQLAMQNFTSKHDAIVVFDADNVAAAGFLKEINACMQQGFVAVQGMRTAKNDNTQVAGIDGLGEAYYNLNARQVPFIVGSSATIAGSGMAVESVLFAQFMVSLAAANKDKTVIPAEDKVLQAYIVQQGFRIAYEPNAIVYDEKTEHASQIKRQRTRWLFSYFTHLKYGFRALLRPSFNSFYFGLLQIYPPMFITVICSVLLLVAGAFVSLPVLAVAAFCLLIFCFHFVYSAFKTGFGPRLMKALPGLPLFVLGQIGGMLQMKKASKDFLATEHRVYDIKTT